MRNLVFITIVLFSIFALSGNTYAQQEDYLDAIPGTGTFYSLQEIDIEELNDDLEWDGELDTFRETTNEFLADYSVHFFTEAGCDDISVTMAGNLNSYSLYCEQQGVGWSGVTSGTYSIVIEGCSGRLSGSLTVDKNIQLVICPSDLDMTDCCSEGVYEDGSFFCDDECPSSSTTTTAESTTTTAESTTTTAESTTTTAESTTTTAESTTTTSALPPVPTTSSSIIECDYGSCSSNAECTNAIGQGWICKGGCCEEIAVTSTIPAPTTTTIPLPPPTTTIAGGLCPTEAVYGEHSEEVETLRYIRDNILNKTPEGREIIRLYYQWSPAIVQAMEVDEEFKEEIKELLDGVLMLIGG